MNVPKTPNTPLYQLASDLERFITDYELAHMDAETGEILSSPDFAEMDIHFQDLQIEFEEKVDRLACTCRNIDSHTTALKDEVTFLTSKIRVNNNRVAGLKNYIQYCFVRAGIERVKATFSTRLQMSNPSVLVNDTKQVPLGYFIEQPPKLDKDAIKKALTKGEVVPGCELRTNNKHVRIS